MGKMRSNIILSVYLHQLSAAAAASPLLEGGYIDLYCHAKRQHHPNPSVDADTVAWRLVWISL